MSSAYAVFIMTHNLNYKIVLSARCKKKQKNKCVSANFTLLDPKSRRTRRKAKKHGDGKSMVYGTSARNMVYLPGAIK